jgi:hypothetical protein
VHLSAVVKRWGGNGRGGAIGRSGGNGGRRSNRRCANIPATGTTTSSSSWSPNTASTASTSLPSVRRGVNSLHRPSAACVGTRPRSPSRRAARWCRSRRLRPRRTYRPRGRPGPCPARRSSRAGRTDPRRRDGVGHFCRRWAARLPWPALPVGRSGERGTPADGGKVLKVIGAPESAGQRPKLLPSQVLPISGGR